MSTLHVTRGLPGAGKSTWAKAWVAEDPINRARVNRDDLRAMMFGATVGLTHTQEGHITAASHGLVRTHLRRGVDVVVDDTNLRERYVKNWQEIAATCSAGLVFKDFDVTPEEAAKRDAQRPNPVGTQAINHMARFLERGTLKPVADIPVAPAEGTYTAADNAPTVIIVDVDGTLALMGDRSPYDWHLVGTDRPNQPILDIVKAVAPKVDAVIFLSGRDAVCRDQTWAWLMEQFGSDLPYATLLMRPEGDRRRDAVVKRELFDEHVAGHNVLAVFDDRRQVVEMWRSLGLTCLQVAPGNF